MFVIPLGDAPNPKGVPLATYALIAINVLVYLLVSLPLTWAIPEAGDPRLAEYLSVLARELPTTADLDQVQQQITQYDLFVFDHGFRPSAAGLGDLVTSLFLHGGLLHLVGNMLFLWIYGDNVEHRLGSARYIAYYLLTGVVATLSHAAFNLQSGVPLVGASGAISGVLGFYFVWFPHNTVRLLLGLFPFFVRQAQLGARVVLGFYLVVDNLLPLLLLPTGAVAHGAHIGGFIAGLGVAILIDRRQLSSPADFEVAMPPQPSSSPLAESIAHGRFEEAARHYFAMPAHQTRGALSPSDSLALARWLSTTGHPQAALVVYQRQLRDHPIGPGSPEAHLHAGLLLLHNFNQPAAAYQHLVEALDDHPSPDVARAAREALATIAARQKFKVRA